MKLWMITISFSMSTDNVLQSTISWYSGSSSKTMPWFDMSDPFSSASSTFCLVKMLHN
ncbi:hypothetical protein Hanom_Chr08g00757601 [Helianthus anomalus]